MKKGYLVDKKGINNIYPYLSRNIECDVIVVGGGICGAITSYFLAKDGFKVVTIEKNIIGYKNTSISSSCITDFIDELYVKGSTKQIDGNLKRKIYELKQRANTLLDEILVDIKAQEYLKKTDYNIYNTKMLQKGMLKKEVEIRNDLGEKSAIEEHSDIINVSYGINIKGGGRVLNAYDITTKIFEYISVYPNVYIFENTKLKSLTSGYDYVEAITQNGFIIKGKSLILTTSTEAFPIINLPNIEVYRRFSLPINSNISKRICAKILNDIPIYIRNDEKGNMVISGIDTKYSYKMQNPKYMQSLEKENEKRILQFANRLFPNMEISDENTIYSGNIYMTKDSMPIIGEIETVPNVYLNIGVGSTSIAHMLIGADILRDAIKGYYKKDMKYFKVRK